MKGIECGKTMVRKWYWPFFPSGVWMQSILSLHVSGEVPAPTTLVKWVGSSGMRHKKAASGLDWRRLCRWREAMS